MLNFFRRQPVAASNTLPQNNAANASVFRLEKKDQPQPLSAGHAAGHTALARLNTLKSKLTLLRRKQDLLRMEAGLHARSIQTPEKQAPSVKVFTAMKQAA